MPECPVAENIKREHGAPTGGDRLSPPPAKHNVKADGFLPDSKAEKRVQARAAAFVRAYGSVTLKDIRDMGCNTPAKVVYRLREKGILLGKDFDRWEQGAKGRYKRYRGIKIDVEV